jgi:hypothetical protein
MIFVLRIADATYGTVGTALASFARYIHSHAQCVGLSFIENGLSLSIEGLSRTIE